MDDQHQSRPVAQGQGRDLRAGGEPVAALAYDADRYRHHVARMGMTTAQEDDLLEAVWRMMRSFVAQAFGEDAAQLARNVGDGDRATREVSAPVALDSTQSPNENNNSDLASAFGKVGKGD